jgi:transcription elongation factor GreA
MSNPVMLTKAGFERLKRELEELKSKARGEVSEAIREAKSHGDLKENAAYHEAKLNRDRLELRIQELEKTLLIARVVERPESSNGLAHLGSKVTLHDLDFGDSVTLTLVGAYEADPAHDMISVGSPLGQALLGKSVGECLEIEAPEGLNRYRIEAVD